MDIDIAKPRQAGSPAGGETGFIVIEASDGGTHRLNFSIKAADELIWGLQAAKQAIHIERIKAGEPPLGTAYARRVQQFEYGLDVLNEIVLLRSRFEDGSSQDLQIGRKQIADVLKCLSDAQEQLDAFDKDKYR